MLHNQVESYNPFVDNYSEPETGIIDDDIGCYFCQSNLRGQEWIEVHEASGEHFTSCPSCGKMQMLFD
jgi:hypothetical protein